MAAKRFLSIWFMRFLSDIARRLEAYSNEALIVVEEQKGALQVVCVTPAAQRLGLCAGQNQRDALAIAPKVAMCNVAQLYGPRRLEALRRWAVQFSPWVVCQGKDGLGLDISGCAHLFGSEEQLAQILQTQLWDLGFEAALGIADTIGAAWAVARYGASGQGGLLRASGDAIDQEARATRARAPRRPKWQHFQPAGKDPCAKAQRVIIPPGHTYQTLLPLPVAALRLPSTTQEALRQLGLRIIGDLAGQPRAPLTRRFGPEVLHRLDQALGVSPEPMARQVEKPALAVRLSFPEPIGLRDDIEAALLRLATRLCTLLHDQGLGARHMRLGCYFAAGGEAFFELMLAKASQDADQITALLNMKLEGFDVGFGLDMMRLEALQQEPFLLRQPVGHLEAQARNKVASDALGLESLINRLGTRLGVEAITRPHFNETHIPEKTTTLHAAAFGDLPAAWPPAVRERPLLLWEPRRLDLRTDKGRPRAVIRGGHSLGLVAAHGPERLSPQWWLDDPLWRSGVRDYWDITTQEGQRLWIFYAHGASISGGWFSHGQFA